MARDPKTDDLNSTRPGRLDRREEIEAEQLVRAARQMLRALEAPASIPSGRIGPLGRTFHCRVSTIGRKSGGAAKAIAGLAYDKREAAHGSRRDEMESEGGRSTEEMTAILQAVDQAVVRKNGVLALDLEIELPGEFDAGQRRQVAEAIAGWFEEQGCPTHWAIHSHNEYGRYQPHLHTTTTPRRVTDDLVVSTSGPTAINGPAEMMYFRREIVAGAINDVARDNGVELPAGWHGGRLVETGIDRPAKRRRPIVAIKAAERATADDRGLAQINRLIDAGHGDEVAIRRADWVRRSKEARALRDASRERDRQHRAKLRQENAMVRDARAMERRVERSLSEKERAFVVDLHRDHGKMLPTDWEATAAGRGAAFATARALMGHPRTLEPQSNVASSSVAQSVQSADERQIAKVPGGRFGVETGQGRSKRAVIDLTTGCEVGSVVDGKMGRRDLQPVRRGPLEDIEVGQLRVLSDWALAARISAAVEIRERLEAKAGLPVTVLLQTGSDSKIVPSPVYVGRERAGLVEYGLRGFTYRGDSEGLMPGTAIIRDAQTSEQLSQKLSLHLIERELLAPLEAERPTAIRTPWVDPSSVVQSPARTVSQRAVYYRKEYSEATREQLLNDLRAASPEVLRGRFAATLAKVTDADLRIQTAAKLGLELVKQVAAERQINLETNETEAATT